jgi:hypothetical protein
MAALAGRPVHTTTGHAMPNANSAVDNVDCATVAYQGRYVLTQLATDLVTAPRRMERSSPDQWGST